MIEHNIDPRESAYFSFGIAVDNPQRFVAFIETQAN
jgi:hypothetical protein